MTVKKRSRRILIPLLPIAVGATFYFGPSLIHFAYRMGTSDSERELNKTRYHGLANKEAFDKTISSSERVQAKEERMRLFYWFHARGLNIDEGWHESALGEKRRHWSELYKYWTS